MTLFPPPAGGPVIPAGLAAHGDQLTADLNNLITNPLKFAVTGIFARLRQASTTTTLTSGSTTVIQYDTTDEDPYGGWSASATATQPAWSWQPPAGCSGWYHVLVAASLGTVPASTVLRPVILQTGTAAYAVPAAGFTTFAPEVLSASAWIWMLGGSDYVQGAAFLQSSANEPTSTTFPSLLQVSWTSN